MSAAPSSLARRLFWLLPAGLLALTASLLWRFWPDTVPVASAPQEVARDYLSLQAGRLHRLGQPQPYTGWMVEHYPDRVLKSRSMIVAGQLHGLSEGWHPNGRLQIREHFVHGVSHGLRTKWQPDGQRLSEIEIVHGKLHGLFRRWHTNGVLAEELEMRAGQPDGLARSWHLSGTPQAEIQMQLGKVLAKKTWADTASPTASASHPSPSSP